MQTGIPSDVFLRELEAASASTLLRQFAFNDRTEAAAWSCDPRAGILEIVGVGRFDAELIGTWSAVSKTWRWVWDNDEAGIPRNLQEAAMQSFGMGIKSAIPELFIEQFSTDDVDATSVALVVSALNHGCFYRAVHDSGCVHLFVREPQVEPVKEVADTAVCSTVLRIVDEYPVNHRTVSGGFLLGQNFTILDESALHSQFRLEASLLNLAYDEFGRLQRAEYGILGDCKRKFA